MKTLIILPAIALVGAAPPESTSSLEMDVAPPARVAGERLPTFRVVRQCGDLAQTARRDYKPDEDAPVTVRKLNELPPAEGYYAVWRTDERGCPDPIKFDLPQKPRR